MYLILFEEQDLALVYLLISFSSSSLFIGIVLTLSFLPASDLDLSDWSFGVTVGSDFSLLFLASVVLSTLLESSLLWSPWELGGGSSVLKFAGQIRYLLFEPFSSLPFFLQEAATNGISGKNDSELNILSFLIFFFILRITSFIYVVYLL
nr:hypothetical protein [Mycoplasmopsis bovis]